MRLTLHLLCLLAVVMVTTAGRFGGGGRSGGSRGGWGSSSSSRGSGTSSWGSSSSSRGSGTSSWGSSSSGSRTSSSGTSSSGFGSHSSGSSHTPSIGWRVGTSDSTSHILPLSSGARTPIKPSSTNGGVHSPSAPSLPGTNSNSHAPSAPPMSFSPGSNKPPSPGWHPGVSSDAAKTQHITNTGQAPPPYPGANTHYPNAAGNNPHHAPPPYSPGSHYPVNQAPPPYPGANTHYPNAAPPPYSAGNYPHHAPPPYSPGNQGPHYYPHQAPPAYPGAHYPPPPPPHPGFSPYGATYYKDRSGVRGSDVVAGLALWELMRHNHHHGYGVQQVHHHHYNEDTTYHDTMRERYTTRITPNTRTSSGPGAYNILEMTHYITPDEKGEIYSSEGNMTCISVYNARSVSTWHQKQVTDFKKQFPESVYPLYRLENDTASENFTIVPGRIIHREPVSITCCGTSNGKVDLNLLTNGKHPNVNCVNHVGHIPIKKLTFIKTDEVVQSAPAGPWYPVELHEPNATTPTPLATFPPGWNETPTLNLTGTTLAPFSPNVTNTTTLAPFSPNVTNTTTLVAPFSSSSDPAVVPTATSVDFNQTFSPLEVNNNTASVNVTQVFDSLGSNGTTESSIVVTTNSPNDLIME